jgi:hypothetical protein
VANRFPLFTDADVHGPLIKALIERGWDIIRSVDTFPEGTDDEVQFEYATKAERVFVTNDQPAVVIAHRWLSEGRSFRGMITWPQVHYRHMTYGDIVRRFDALAEEADPFGKQPIRYIKP